MKRLDKKVIFALMLLSVGSIGASYERGVRLGLDTRITWGIANDAYCMTVAFSRLLFGFHEGYIGYNAITVKLAEILSPSSLNPPDTLALLHSPVAIQTAFDAVQKIDPATLPVYKTAKDGNFRNIWADDIGYADFYTLAFAIFGYHPNAMYQCFFLIMGLSILIFIKTYRRQIAPMASLALACCTFSVFMFSDIFTAPPFGTTLMPSLATALMPSVNANRFMSTLGFIPILHLFWTLRYKQLPSRAAIA